MRDCSNAVEAFGSVRDEDDDVGDLEEDETEMELEELQDEVQEEEEGDNKVLTMGKLARRRLKVLLELKLELEAEELDELLLFLLLANSPVGLVAV